MAEGAQGNAAMLQGIQAVLQQATQALAQLQPAGGAETSQAASLMHLLSQAQQTPGATNGGDSVDPACSQEFRGLTHAEMHLPLPSAATEFVLRHNLDPWVNEAFDMMTPDQLNAVVRTPLSLAGTHNPHGVLYTRIKEVSCTEQRVLMFTKVNLLSDGVVDRLSTITTEQQDKVMELSLKIMKANNPSGVAMKRITDVLRNDRIGQHAPPSRPAAVSHSDPLASMLMQLSQQLGVAPAGGSLSGGTAQDRGYDRSRSRGPAAGSSSLAGDVQDFVQRFQLEPWLGEVLNRLGLYQRQNIMKDMINMNGVRNPSGVVMSRVKTAVATDELLSIFIDINSLDRNISDQLWDLTPVQQNAVMAPGIYVQNVRNPSTAVRSRIQQVLAGNDAMGSSSRRSGNG